MKTYTPFYWPIENGAYQFCGVEWVRSHSRLLIQYHHNLQLYEAALFTAWTRIKCKKKKERKWERNVSVELRRPLRSQFLIRCHPTCICSGLTANSPFFHENCSELAKPIKLHTDKGRTLECSSAVSLVEIHAGAKD